MTGLIIAMDKELAPLVQNEEVERETRKNLTFYKFGIGDENCVAIRSGIGKVNAAYAATVLINEFNPDVIVSTGISGGLGRNNLLDLVVSEKCVQYDVDTSALGDPVGLVSTINKIYFYADETLVKKFVEKCGAKKAVLACGDRFVADEKTKKTIVDLFDAGACDMESGAIAQVAYLENKPYVALRCISDGAGDGAELDYEKMTNKAAEILAKAIRTAIS